MTVHGGRRRLGIARAERGDDLPVILDGLLAAPRGGRRCGWRLARPSARIDSMKRPRIALPAATRIASWSSRSVVHERLRVARSPPRARVDAARRAGSSVTSSIRSAASAAIAGSTTLRASNSWSDAVLAQREHKAQVPHEQVGLERGHVGAGAVRASRYTPSTVSARSASRSDDRLTPIDAASSRSAGSRSPGPEVALLDQVEQARHDLLRHRLPRDGAERGGPTTRPPYLCQLRGSDPLRRRCSSLDRAHAAPRGPPQRRDHRPCRPWQDHAGRRDAVAVRRLPGQRRTWPTA